jgi:2,4-dienoyl-CoA reductase-like NADH-dependent reductase (Old Yellow Enzyme family)
MSLSPAPLFTPFTSPKLQLKNRWVMAPMTRMRSPDGIPGQDVADYYRRRAENEVGLIITEGTLVNHPAANGYPQVPYFYSDKSLAGWQNVVKAVHGAGGKIFPQLWHVGSMRKAGAPPDPTVPGYSPSGIAKPGGKVVCHEMTKDDIRAVVRAFADAARAAKDIGMDGVELHGAHGYLIDQFFWKGTNRRTDEYGGSLVKRTRFAVEIIEAVRKAVGDDFPVMLRWSQWKQQEYTARLAPTPDELAQFLTPLTDAGVDIFHCSTRRWWLPEFDGSPINIAGWTKQITGKPVVTVGSIGLDIEFTATMASAAPVNQVRDIDALIERFTQGEFDLVCVGRSLLADPAWVSRIRNGDWDGVQAYNKGSEMVYF